MKHMALAAAIAIAIVFGTGATTEAYAKSLVGSAALWVVIEERHAIDEFFGRVAAWWYGVEFEGGAVYGTCRC